jgi:hypothetical protein
VEPQSPDLFPDEGGFVFVLADAADGKDLAVHDDEDAR